ncbi:MAG TPA: hypothetical protein VEZ13_20405, partial [Brevibacillus sp.]|nr:hypothetical protein [Brevibacillus sp.]
PLHLLDAGCGEGSHLVSIQQKILERTKIAPLGVGLDISKEGIKIAAKRSSNTIWCVADLARCPVMDRSGATAFPRTDDSAVMGRIGRPPSAMDESGTSRSHR